MEIDTLKYQLQNTDIKLEFLSNEEVRISIEMDDEKNTLINYDFNDTEDFVPEEEEFSQVFPLNRCWIRLFSVLKFEYK